MLLVTLTSSLCTRIMIDQYWKILNTISLWIQAADTKAGIILAGLGVSVTLAKYNESITNSDLTEVRAILSSLILISSILTAFFCFRSLIPRISLPRFNSSIYFNSITQVTNEEYVQTMLNNEENIKHLELDLLNQIAINAKIASIKHKNVSLGIIFFFITILAFTVNGNLMHIEKMLP